MLALPSTLPDPDRGTPGPYHCETCVKSKGPGSRGPVQRARMHCTKMPRAEWLWPMSGRPSSYYGIPYNSEACPGGLARTPIVAEAAQAYQASEAKMLDRWDPFDLHVVNEAVMAATRAFNLHQLAKLKPRGQVAPPRGT